MSLPSFGARRPVPANLLMMVLIVGGIWSGFTLRREFFPEIDPEAARVEMVYPGASPEELEESMARKVEDAVGTIDEVRRIETTVTEGVGVIVVKFDEGTDVAEGVSDVERAIERLSDLPADAERIRVLEFEPNLPVVIVTLFGDADERILKRGLRRIADDLETLPGMGSLQVSGLRDYEVRVEVDPDRLVEYGVPITEVADAIRAWMLELPSGTVRGRGGNISVRTMGVEERADAVRAIVVRALPGGEAIRVQDLALIEDGFVDTPIEERFDGSPAASLTIYKTGRQDAVRIARMAYAYVAGRKGESFPGPFWASWIGDARGEAYQVGLACGEPLPAELVVHNDLSRFIQGRLELLSRNALQGAVLVFLALMLVLNLRVAFWVMIGLFTAICGTLLVMQAIGVTLNLLTMFGLLVTLGMLTDDAIVVAENIAARGQRGDSPIDAAIKGGEQVFWPVVGTVLTTIVAFMPLVFLRGNMGKLLGALPMVVFCALLISLLESMLILPSHMVHALRGIERSDGGGIFGAADRFADWRDRRVVAPLTRAYGRVAALSVRFRWIAASIALSVLASSLGMVSGGRVEFVFLPVDDAENVVVDLRMPAGTELESTREVARRIEDAARAQSEVVYTSLAVGQSFDINTGLADPASTSIAQIFFELSPIEDRDRPSPEIIDAIRTASGDLSAVERISWREIDGGPGGAAITFEVAGDDAPSVDSAVADLKRLLAGYQGVFGISDDDEPGQRELRISLVASAASLGIDVREVAQQVRGAIHGLEAHVFSADREDIDVRVVFDEENRRSVGGIEDMWITTRDGRSIPLAEIARLTEAEASSSIKRIDRRRAVTVTAEVDANTSPESVVSAMLPEVQGIRDAHPGVTLETGGRQQDVYDAFSSLPVAMGAACVMIYVILAWLFGSYLQPFAVMLAIPFSLIGVVWGHWVLGFQLTFLSLIGVVALAGVVVNNSLILVEFFNLNRRSGMPLEQALVEAGKRRLRPIVLTTTTTILGLTPLMLEPSFQARFLVPMAISITLGLASATVLTLLLLPAILVIADDLVAAAHWLWFGMDRSTRRRGVEARHGRPADLGDEGGSGRS
ncbi:MAG: efflux RND transporter permease subunit [Planctomycetota bacterium]|nr:efflux RND transporter permease subunit [Planctomycetota bacterium]